MRKSLVAVVPAMVAAWIGVGAQEYEPTCKMCPGTYIDKSEVDAYLKRAIDNRIVDQQIRGVDIGKNNVGIGIVYRGRLEKPEAGVAEHDLVSELYHIIEGSGTLAVGPELVNKERRPASSKTVRVQNGPGNNARAIRNPQSFNLAPGDVVVIPAGTGHQFTKIDDKLVYLMVRFDPDKIVPTKGEAESKADLLTSGNESAEEARAEGAKNKHLEKEYAPTCDSCPGTHIPSAEVQAYIKRAIANQLVDQQVRAVDIGKSNIGVGVVYRGKLAKPEANVAEHDLVSEVYHIIDGAATLKLGPDLIGKKRRPATMTTVRLLNGPGNGATDIRNGVSYDLKAGDVVVIPAGTGHQFTRIDDHVTYLMVRVDPDKVLPLKSEAESKADLQTDGRSTAGGGAGAAPTAGEPQPAGGPAPTAGGPAPTAGGPAPTAGGGAGAASQPAKPTWKELVGPNGPTDMKLSDPALLGAIDVHAHLDPDISGGGQVARAMDAVDMARQAKARGMRGFVYKTHLDMGSATSAYFARKAVPGIEVFGRFALNLPVGGLNPAAVMEFISIKGGWGRIIEMPTRDNSIPAKDGRPWVLPWLDLFPNIPRNVPTVRNGEVVPELKNLIALIAKVKTAGSDGRVVIATGHASPEAHILIAKEARRQGVEVLLTHPGASVPRAALQEVAKLGAYIEVMADFHQVGEDPEEKAKYTFDTIRQVGAGQVIMGTDCGQMNNPFPADCIALAARKLRSMGLTEGELNQILKENPARYLGLPPSPASARSR